MGEKITKRERGLDDPDKPRRKPNVGSFNIFEAAGNYVADFIAKQVGVPRKEFIKAARKIEVQQKEELRRQAKYLNEARKGVETMASGLERDKEESDKVWRQIEEREQVERDRATGRSAEYTHSSGKLPGADVYRIPLGQIDESNRTGNIRLFKDIVEDVASNILEGEAIKAAGPVIRLFGKAGSKILTSPAFKRSRVFGVLTKSAEKVIAKKGTPVSIYFSVDLQNEIRYVGISDDPVVRQFRHFRGFPDRQINLLFTVGTRDEARGVEQLLIERYGLEKSAGSLENKLNSISPSSREYKRLTDLGRKALREMGFTDF